LSRCKKNLNATQESTLARRKQDLGPFVFPFVCARKEKKEKKEQGDGRWKDVL
jgi:hypothetical protein